MDRKLFRSGNSIVLALPRELIEPLGIGEGDVVAVNLDRESRQITITPVQREKLPGVDEEFARQVAEFIEEYRPALLELARR
jgi:putative addiction module antidote